MHDTRSAIESLAAWAGKPQSALDLVRAHWTAAVHPRATGADVPLRYVLGPHARAGRRRNRPTSAVGPRRRPHLRARLARPRPRRHRLQRKPSPPLRPDALPADAFALVLYPKVGMLDGRHGAQRLAARAARSGDESHVGQLRLPLAGRGSAAGRRGRGLRARRARRRSCRRWSCRPSCSRASTTRVVAIALGYGRAGTDRFGNVGPPWFEARPLPGVVGVNASPLGHRRRTTRASTPAERVTVTRTGRGAQLASTQVHHSLEPPGSTERRPIIQEIDARRN